MCLLNRLVHDRELQLFDGRRLLRADRYDALKESGEDMTALERIHPDFHIIATAGLPDGKKKWLTPELLNLFFFHELPPVTEEEELSIIQAYVSVFIFVWNFLILFALHGIYDLWYWFSAKKGSLRI